MGGHFLFINLFVLVLLFINVLFIQNISNINKKSIFYGVSVPIGYEKDRRLIKLHKEYQRRYSISFLIISIVMAVILVNISDELEAIFILPEILFCLVSLAINYLITFKKVKGLKKIEGWQFEDKNVVIVDTGFRSRDENNKRIVISPWWFLIPLGIVIFNLVILMLKIPTLKDEIGDQNFFLAIFPVLIQVLISLLLFGAYKWTEKAKQSLNGGELNEVKVRSRRIRYYLSVTYLLICIYINILFMLIGFSVYDIINLGFVTSKEFMIISTLLPVLIVAIAILAIIKNNNSHKLKTKLEQQIINRDDDRYYKFGIFYYNKNDPSLFVENRVGIGATLNLARPVAKIIMSIIVLSIIATFVLLMFTPEMTKERIVDITQDTIIVHGTWGPDINKQQITKVTLENKLPKILLKTNGADIKNKLFGMHKLEGYKNSALFIADKTKPFVVIYLEDGSLVLINYVDENRTKSLYDNVISSMKLQ